jgi:hypothetical protein
VVLGVGEQLNHVAIADRQNGLDALFAPEGGVGFEMHGLAVNRDKDIGLEPVVELGQFMAPRVAGHVDHFVATRNDLDAFVDQLVLDVLHGLFVAGNGPGRKDRHIAR